MAKHSSFWLFTGFVLFGSAMAQAQTKRPHPLVLSVFNESIALPSTQLIKSPLHPGVMVGKEFFLSEKKYSNWLAAIYMGYYFHRNMHHAVYLNPAFGYQFDFGGGFNLHTQLGLGYMHSFSAVPTYVLQDGQYQRDKSLGRSHLMPNASLGAGYDFRRKHLLPFEVFVRYQAMMQTHFAPRIDIPLLPHTAFHVGIKL